jgi:hypothetical protein
MRMTIIPADRMVIVDGAPRSPLVFDVDSAIHAVQWYGDHGEVEFVVGSDGGKPPNVKITDLAQFQSALDAWFTWMPPSPSKPPEPPPVTQVSMRQARLALLAADLLDDVEVMMSEADRAVRIEWEYATVVDRNSPLVAAIGSALGLTDEQIDALFADAATR